MILMMIFHSANTLHGNWKVALFFCYVSVGLFQCTAASEDAQTLLRVVLVDWINTSNALSSWNSSTKSPCAWKGVACNDLNAVTTVNLTKAWISGNLTSKLCRLSSLSTLIMQENHFGGPFPNGLLECKGLRVLDLSHNQFAGSLPNRIYELRELRVLKLGHNGFSGHVPAGFGLLGNLEALLLESNSLSGTIPTFVGEMTNLTNLTRQTGMSSGELGENPKSVIKLVELNLSNNRLTGEIPESLATLPALNRLDLSNNFLSGRIPSELVGSLKLSSFNVSGNRLRGQIPIDLGNSADKNGSEDNTELCGRRDLGFGSCSFPHKSSHRPLTPVLTPLLLLAAVSLCVFFCLRKRRETPRWKLTSFHTSPGFDESHIIDKLIQGNRIGSGVEGEVYKVILPNQQQVAVKKIQGMGRGKQHYNELEVNTLRKLQHDNILKLQCCISSEEENLKLWVCDYMPNRSLYDCLYRSPQLTLQWPVRYNIAVGAARGLSYMHHDCCPPILHRDVKSSNILLDSDFHPKIADFGLCREVKNLGDSYAVSDYRVRANSKSDVYSFGKVLLQLVSGKKATGDVEFGEGFEIAGWIRSSMNRGKQVVDRRIEVENHMKEIMEVLDVGLQCTNESPEYRPSMRKVVKMLEMCKTNAPSQQWTSGLVWDETSPITPHSGSENEIYFSG